MSQPTMCKDWTPYSLFTNDMQRFSGNIFAAKCRSYMGFLPSIYTHLYVWVHKFDNLPVNSVISLVNWL